MNITTFTDYTLRVLIYLAAHEDDKSTADDIATAYGISFHHVAKAAQWLAREGYINSERGRGGGISLARPSADINIGEIVQQSESRTVLVDCMREGGGSCAITPACGLKHALAEAQSAFFTALKHYTLQDVTRRRTALQDLLLKA